MKSKITLLMVLLLLLGGVSLPVTAAEAACTVTVAIYGQLLDAKGAAVAGETVQLNFFLGPEALDVKRMVETGADGYFRLEESFTQLPYENAGNRAAEVQGTIVFAGSVTEFSYQPGAPQQFSSTGLYDRWAESGAYQADRLQLFHSFRLLTNRQERFADLAVQLGSATAPCVFQLGQGLDPEPGAQYLVVNHLLAETDEPQAAAERHLIARETEAIVTNPDKATGLAPLTVVLNGERMAEAERGRPITGFTVDRVQTQDRTESELTYYYHQDRDGDGVPDYLVLEQFREVNGAAVAGLTSQVQVIANRDRYVGQPPEKLTGYQYLGYIKDDGALIAGIPTERITSNASFHYIYEQQGRETDQSGGSGKDRTGEADLGNSEEPAPLRPPEQMPDEDPLALTAEPDPEANAGNRRNPETEPAAPAESTLTATEREERRSLTFIKRSLEKTVYPGERVEYAFTGFENQFPYALNGFTLIDSPDEGLEFVSIALPAFTKGQGVTYDITGTTNHQGEHSLALGIDAERSFQLTTPPLAAGERLTALYVRISQVPPGFGQGDEILLTFQVWEDPPTAELNNLGLLIYEEMGSLVERHSADENTRITVDPAKSRTGSRPGGGQAASFQPTIVGAALKNHLAENSLPWLSASALLIGAGTLTTRNKRKQKKKPKA